MKKLLMIGAVVLIVVAATSGCIFSEGVSAEQVKQNFFKSYSQNVNSYELTMAMTIEMISGDLEMKMTITGTATVDVANQCFQMNIRSSIFGGDIAIESYLVDGAMYWYTESFGESTWIKTDNYFGETDPWDYGNLLDQQKALLEISDVEMLDDKFVDGEKCYVLKITVRDIDRLCEILMNQQGLGSMSQSTTTYLSDMIKGVVIEMAIGKSDNLIREVYEYITMEMSMFEGYTYHMTLEMRIVFSNYNGTVNIQLPSEALEAIDYTEFLESYSEYFDGLTDSPA